MAAVMVATHYGHELIVHPDGTIFVNADGVLLSTEATNRYFKVRPGRPANQGTFIRAFLEAHSIEPRTIVDVGANFGEISLYLARVFPLARVVAVEPSPENLAVFEKNLGVQSPPLDNLVLATTAIADYEGTGRISSGLGAENQLQSGDSTDTDAAVSCTTLPKLLRDHGIDSVDFLKLDIEGSEPLLTDDLAQLAPRVRSLLVEFSRKNSQVAYMRLLTTLGSHYAVFYVRRLPLAASGGAATAQRGSSV